MLITVLLILCLPLVDVGFCVFVNEPKWNWKESCKDHPFATEQGEATPDTSKLNGDKCTLEFEYPKNLREAGMTEDKQFCKVMFPDGVTKAEFDGDNIKCEYARGFKCSEANGTVIGDKCVFIDDKAQTFDGAKATCKPFGRLLRPNDNTVIQFLIRLYQWSRPDAVTWGVDNEQKPRHVFLGYSAIGDHLPGSSEAATDLTKSATVVCVGPAEPATANQKARYCAMLNEFLQIPTEQSGKTCYWTTGSVMHAESKFFRSCRAAYGQLSYAAVPTTNGQKDMFNKFAARLIGGKKRHLMLPASWNGKTPEPKKHSVKEAEAARFTYKLAKLVNGNTTSADMTVPYNVRDWADGYPKPQKSPTDYPRRGALLWNGKIQNVDANRRAPMMCAAGPSLPIIKYCTDDWEVAHRKTYSICYKVISIGGCPTEAVAKPACKNIKAQLGPANSGEEESAIVRAVNRLYPTGLNSRVMIDGRWNGNGFIYSWDNEVVGNSIYPKWHPGEPKREGRSCNFLTNKCAEYESCVALKIDGGEANGLMDGYCNDMCMNHFMDMDSIACAKKAVMSEVDFK